MSTNHLADAGSYKFGQFEKNAGRRSIIRTTDAGQKHKGGNRLIGSQLFGMLSEAGYQKGLDPNPADHHRRARCTDVARRGGAFPYGVFEQIAKAAGSAAAAESQKSRRGSQRMGFARRVRLHRQKIRRVLTPAPLKIAKAAKFIFAGFASCLNFKFQTLEKSEAKVPMFGTRSLPRIAVRRPTALGLAVFSQPLESLPHAI